jgi:hypothetical protein
MMYDEDIPTELLPPSLQHEDDAAVKLKSNEVRIGPMTRARANLLKQRVNLFLNDTLIDENFILSNPLLMYDQVRRWSKHRTRRRGAVGREAGHGVGYEAGQEDIPRKREGGEGGMREGGRSSPGRCTDRTDRPPRRPARSQARSNRTPRRKRPAPAGSSACAIRAGVLSHPSHARSPPGPWPGRPAP